VIEVDRIAGGELCERSASTTPPSTHAREQDPTRRNATNGIEVDRL